MLIEGEYDESEIIREMLEDEYAFSIEYENGQEIRCAHHKGLWTYAHFKNGELSRSNLLDDTCSMKNWGQGQTEDPLLEGFVEAKKQIASKFGYEDCRALPAYLLWSVFELLTGGARVVSVDVKQGGRNATVNMLTGEFELSET